MKTYPLAYQNQQQHQLKQLQSELKQQRKKGLLQRGQQQNVQEEKHHKVYKEETDVTLVVGRAAWWIPVLATNNNMQNLTFAEALRDFLQNVSFHCYGKLVETGRCYQEKLFWLVFHIAALSTLIVFLWHNTTIEKELLRTNIHDPLYPIQNVPFPTVSICSTNRISNASAARYAEELNTKDPQHRGVKYFYEMIKMLRYNYYLPYDNNYKDDYDKALEFQQFLDVVDRMDGEVLYDTRKRMAMLTPNCSDVLQYCSFGHQAINCAEVFEEAFTSWGLCCIFDQNNKLLKQRNFSDHYVGVHMGLTALLRAPREDDLYKIFDLNGFIVSLHEPFSHPDLIPGGGEKNFAITGLDSFFSMKARVYKTAKEARFYSPKARNCLFKDELPEIYESGYSFENCITLCRLGSVFALCGCFPFQAPFQNISTPTDAPICSLQHKECLMRYSFKWFNVITQRKDIPGLEREMEDALYCPECLPSCSETRYEVELMSLSLRGQKLHHMANNYQHNSSELAMVRIYFEIPTAIYYKQVLVGSWFEDLSEVGNICGIIAGFSLIGICEVVFFFIKQFITAYKREVLCDGHSKAPQTLRILP